MPSVVIYGKNNVVTEAKKRITMLFRNNSSVYFSFSGGKESLVIAILLEDLISSGSIDATKLIVSFVDEEAIYPDVEKICLDWRKRFMMLGAKFYWLCLPIRHYNCFNMLYNDLSFICWDPSKKDVWIRKKPEFAIKSHPKFKKDMTYQSFMLAAVKGPQMIGLRAYESYQRRVAVSHQKPGKKKNGMVYPILDWSLNDVWLYLKDSGHTIPKAYQFMWKTGVSGGRLRISQFFSIDTAASLVNMVEYYPGLYQKILDREPNAYLAMMYWDSDMFRRKSTTKKEVNNTDIDDPRSWGIKHLKELLQTDKKMYMKLKKFIAAYGGQLTTEGWTIVCSIIKAGDPKGRTARRLYSCIGENVYGNTKANKQRKNSK